MTSSIGQRGAAAFSLVLRLRGGGKMDGHSDVGWWMGPRGFPSEHLRVEKKKEKKDSLVHALIEIGPARHASIPAPEMNQVEASLT